MLHGLSFDIEELYHAELVRQHVTLAARASQVEAATEPLLNLLARRGLRATFFIVGEVMRDHPALVRAISAAGHEIGCHSMSHRPLWELTPETFRAELREFKALWSATNPSSQAHTSATNPSSQGHTGATTDSSHSTTEGRRSLPSHSTLPGFRAPTFSLVQRTSWALDVLAREGFTYDSSIFPVANYMYGLNGGPLAAYRPRRDDLRREDANGPILELPMTAWQIAGRRLPVSGGFYLRALPTPLLMHALRQVSKQRPIVLYLHPWEAYDGTPVVSLPLTGRLITYYNRASVLPKLERILDEFAFGPLCDVLEARLMTDQTTNRPFLILCAAILSVIMLADLVAVLRITNNHDFAVYYNAAVRLRNGEDIFAETSPFRTQVEKGTSTKNADTPWPYSYPPFLAVSVLPLSFLTLAQASAAWTALGVLALAISCWLALRSQKWLTLTGSIAVLLLAYQFDPAVIGLRLGQMDVMIFLLIVLAFWQLKQGHDGRAGLALAVAIGLKFFSVFIVGYLLWKRRWRAALTGGVLGAILSLGSFALTGGLDSFKRFLDFSSIYTSGAFAGYFYHQSLNAFFTRLLKPNMFTPPLAHLPWLGSLLTIAASALLFAGLLWLTRKAAPPSGERFDLEYALVIVTMLLVIPPSPRYSFTYLLLCFIIVAARAARGSLSLPVMGVFALSFILSARAAYFPVKLVWRLVQEGQFMLSALLLWAVIAWLLLRPIAHKGET